MVLHQLDLGLCTCAIFKSKHCITLYQKSHLFTFLETKRHVTLRRKKSEGYFVNLLNEKGLQFEQAASY